MGGNCEGGNFGWGSRYSACRGDGDSTTTHGGGRGRLLWHIVKHYDYGSNEFVVALGYQGDDIKRYLPDYFSVNSNVRIRHDSGEVDATNGNAETLNLIDTGLPPLLGAGSNS